jgi:hypothetical protein
VTIFRPDPNPLRRGPQKRFRTPIDGKSYGMELQFFFNIQDKSEQPYWSTLENYVIDNDENQYGKNLLVLCLLVEVGLKGDTKRESNKGLKYLSMAADAFVRPNNEGKYRAYSTKQKVNSFLKRKLLYVNVLCVFF